MTFALSLDFGTGGVRAGVFDVASGTLSGMAEVGYPTRHIRPNRAEQDALDWWSAAARAVREAAGAAGDPEIEAICVAAFSSTVVFSDRAGNPLGPAILWMDARASAEAEFTGTVDHPLMSVCGGADAVEWLVPKAMWMARNQPDLWERCEVCCEALDWVNFRLTGTWAGSLMTATCKWNYDSRARRFDRGLFETFGVAGLADKLPGNIVGIGRTVGRITPAAARHLGIRGEPIVVQGGIDAHMGVFGAATVEAGDVLFIGGTSNVFVMQIPDDGTALDGVWGPYPDAVVEGLRLVEAGQVSAGSVLSWLTDTIFGLDAQGRQELWAKAASVGVADTGLLTLDYFMGNRTPYRDARLRGAVLGLSLSHDRASLYRSAVTSVALGSANIVADLERQNQKLRRLVVAGGILRNPLWLEATIDAMGLPAHVAEVENLTLYGCAAACAFGLGLHPDLPSAARALEAPTTPRLPDKSRHAGYKSMLREYREATDLLRPVLHRLSDDQRQAQ
jgi:hypothetical protein